MTIEVVIPALRQESVERLVWSLDHQTTQPDLITIVSNEVQPFRWSFGTRARLLRFDSAFYAIGELDVALRQNVGIWTAESDSIVIQGDDQIAPPTMIEDTLSALETRSYLWGNHRLLDFTDLDADDIMSMSRDRGMSRENPVPPAMHGYYSCYGGMFAAKTSFIRDFGGFDMAFNGRHGSEDQQLGYRLMRMSGQPFVEIIEPPFSWHPIELKQGDTRARHPWLEPKRNGCEPGAHLFQEEQVNGLRFMRCINCPMLSYVDEGAKLFTGEIVLRYEPELVETESVWL